MKKAIESINTFYASRAKGAMYELKAFADNPHVGIYCGIRNPKTPVMYAAVSAGKDCTFAEFYEVFNEDAFKVLRNYSDCFGRPQVILYNRDEDLWFKIDYSLIGYMRIKKLNSNEKLFSINLKQIRITEEGPDYLEKVKNPFSLVKPKKYILSGIENPFS